MIFIIGVAFFALAKKFRDKLHTWNNPGALFLLLWGSIFVGYSFRLFNIYSTDWYIILVFILGIISFSIGAYPKLYKLGKTTFEKDYEKSVEHFKIENSKRYIFLALSIIATVILIIRDIYILPFWSGGVSMVKWANIEGIIEYPRILQLLYSFYAYPIEIVSVFIMAIYLFFNKDFLGKIQIAVSMIMILASYIGSGSKFSLFIPILSVMVVHNIYNNIHIFNMKKEQMGILKKLLLVVLVVFVIISILYLLNQKSGGWIKNLYFYFVGCIPFGGYTINSTYGKSYYYGMVSLNGVFRMIALICSVFGIGMPYAGIMNKAYAEMQSFQKAIYITPTVKYNAFSTMFAYFYRDGGLIAVIVFSLILGLICKNVYNRLKKESSGYSLIMYLFIIYIILFGIVRIQTFLLQTIPIIIYIKVLFQERRFSKK